MNLQVIYTKTAFTKQRIPIISQETETIIENFSHHKLRIQKLCKQKDSFINKEKFYELYFQNNAEIFKTIIEESTKMGHYNLISSLWLISNLRKGKHQKRKEYIKTTR